MGLFSRVAARIAVALSGLAFAYTALWLMTRDWHWSNGTAVIAEILGVPALFLICISFRDQSTRRSVNLALAMLAITALLYGVFPRVGA